MGGTCGVMSGWSESWPCTRRLGPRAGCACASAAALPRWVPLRPTRLLRNTARAGVCASLPALPEVGGSTAEGGSPGGCHQRACCLLQGPAAQTHPPTTAAPPSLPLTDHTLAKSRVGKAHRFQIRKNPHVRARARARTHHVQRPTMGGLLHSGGQAAAAPPPPGSSRQAPHDAGRQQVHPDAQPRPPPPPPRRVCLDHDVIGQRGGGREQRAEQLQQQQSGQQPPATAPAGGRAAGGQGPGGGGRQ